MPQFIPIEPRPPLAVEAPEGGLHGYESDINEAVEYWGLRSPPSDVLMGDVSEEEYIACGLFLGLLHHAKLFRMPGYKQGSDYYREYGRRELLKSLAFSNLIRGVLYNPNSELLSLEDSPAALCTAIEPTSGSIVRGLYVDSGTVQRHMGELPTFGQPTWHAYGDLLVECRVVQSVPAAPDLQRLPPDIFVTLLSAELPARS